VIDGSNDALIVEVNNIDLLVEYIRVEEGDLSGAPADVVPGLVVKDTDARWRAQNLDHFVFGRGAGMNLGDLILRGQIAALLDARRTARNQRHSRDCAVVGG